MWYWWVMCAFGGVLFFPRSFLVRSYAIFGAVMCALDLVWSRNVEIRFWCGLCGLCGFGTAQWPYQNHTQKYNLAIPNMRYLFLTREDRTKIECITDSKVGKWPF